MTILSPDTPLLLLFAEDAVGAIEGWFQVADGAIGARGAGVPIAAEGERILLILRGPEVAPLTRLRASWRAIHPAVSKAPATGRIRPTVTMEWARSGRPGTTRRPGAASAPWSA